MSNEVKKSSNFKHGYRMKKKHPLYVKWLEMKTRCYNKNRKQYKDYGGRGIIICKEWKNNPKLFIEWGLINGYSKKLDLDRIDNNGNYSPENCRFTTRSINSTNTRIKNTNTSGLSGISYHSRDNMWQSFITVQYKRYYLGYHNTKLSALRARNSFIRLWNLPHKIQILPEKSELQIFDEK